jgi:2-C-methyl-D-erythritol 2,4-cyclodiphosphate synthase
MVGIGYDIHRLVEKRPLYLGGIRIDYNKGLLGHSDGDVLLHAIADALLGAAHLGDIGQHFPPDDNRYKDISSNDILRNVAGMLESKGMSAKHVDAIVICEAPRILPYVAAMKKNIAAILKVADTTISIKGKTNEGIGAIGKGEAIAAWAVCEVEKLNAST